MDLYRVIEVKQSVFADNDAEAARLRETLNAEGVFLINLMSSPGSGKTTTLTRLIPLLQKTLRVGVMEADIDSDVDADTISRTGAAPAERRRQRRGHEICGAKPRADCFFALTNGKKRHIMNP